MKYRDARLLLPGDELTLKSDQSVLIVKEIQAFGQYKKVMITAYLKNGDASQKLIYYNDDVDAAFSIELRERN